MAENNDAEQPAVLPSAPPEETIESVGSDVDAMRLALVVLAVIGSILMLQFAKPVLIPVVVAFLISYVLGPAVSSMEKRQIPRVLGSFVAIAALCGSIGFGVYTLTDEALAVVENVPARRAPPGRARADRRQESRKARWKRSGTPPTRSKRPRSGRAIPRLRRLV